MLQNNFCTAAVSFYMAGRELVTGSHDAPDLLAKASAKLATKYQELLTVSNFQLEHMILYVLAYIQAGLILAGVSIGQDIESSITGYLYSISTASNMLLLAAKNLSVDPNTPNVKSQLVVAIRLAATTYNKLYKSCDLFTGLLLT